MTKKHSKIQKKSSAKTHKLKDQWGNNLAFKFSLIHFHKWHIQFYATIQNLNGANKELMPH